jgi:hypothetical protein
VYGVEGREDEVVKVLRSDTSRDLRNEADALWAMSQVPDGADDASRSRVPEILFPPSGGSSRVGHIRMRPRGTPLPQVLWAVPDKNRVEFAIRVGQETLRAVQRAHRVGYAHMDVRTANIVGVGDGFVLCDWSSAVRLREQVGIVRGDQSFFPSGAIRAIENGHKVVAHPIFDVVSILYLVASLSCRFSKAPWAATWTRETTMTCDERILSRTLALRKFPFGRWILDAIKRINSRGTSGDSFYSVLDHVPEEVRSTGSAPVLPIVHGDITPAPAALAEDLGDESSEADDSAETGGGGGDGGGGGEDDDDDDDDGGYDTDDGRSDAELPQGGEEEEVVAASDVDEDITGPADQALAGDLRDEVPFERLLRSVERLRQNRAAEAASEDRTPVSSPRGAP